MEVDTLISPLCLTCQGQPVGHSIRHPCFGTLSGILPGTLQARRARETPVAGPEFANQAIEICEKQAFRCEHDPKARASMTHEVLNERVPPCQKSADVWKKDVWDFQGSSQTFSELEFSLGNEGKEGRNLNSQTWPGSPRRPSPRHPRPPYLVL